MNTSPTSIELPACISAELKVDRNIARQVLVPAQQAALQRDGGEVTAILNDGAQYPVRASRRDLTANERVIKVPRAVLDDPHGVPPHGAASWIGDRERRPPEAVLRSLEGTFRFVAASEDGSQPGLRLAQLGAVHAVLGHWTTDPDEPATVVMPTGTGKTDTMVALLAAVLPERLLVVVPSDSLRAQIAEKFETLGVLPDLRVIEGQVLRPVVGRISGHFSGADSARQFADACNVIVTTPSALFASEATVVAALLERCSHLFVDEAHHVQARTWRQIRDAFKGKPVLQFTATPFREDAQRLGGRQLYRFKLSQAQSLGYFAPVDYTSVVDFASPDRALAARAVERLRQDLAAGLDHVLMARVNRISRAHDIRGLYAELAPEFAPVVLNSRLAKREQRAGLESLFARRSRIVVCVDMLGEGFDLPSLKVAAIHDPHKSLGVTLQYVGRFARSAVANIGRASVFVGRPEGDYDYRLRRLFAEDADWNAIISDLSEAATQDEVEVGEFETGFAGSPDDVPTRTLSPKMSTVVYRTSCEEWCPHRVTDVHDEEDFVTWPVPINPDRRVIWFIATTRSPLPWADLPSVEEVAHHLYVAYWDRTAQRLYINSSNTDSHHEELAKALAGSTVERITGPAVYRAMHNIQRMVPTNVGLLDVRNRNRRFSMLVGADVSDGFPTAEAQTKTQTNIFASGFENGVRVTIGASQKGRVWSYRVAPSLKHWVDWCDHIGAKLGDQSISIEQVMGAFIRPEVLKDRPALSPLALEWPWETWLWTSEDTKVVYAGSSCPLLDAELCMTDHSTEGPLAFEVRTPDWRAPYEAEVVNEQLVYRATAGDVVIERPRAADVKLSDYFAKTGPMILFEQDAVVVPPALLLRPNRELPPFDVERLRVLDWSGVNRRKESQGPGRDADSIQARMITEVQTLTAWDVVLDDDGSGEIADVVALRVDGEWLRVLLLHCKYTSSDTAGARVGDLYEVCGQAQKSIRWAHYTDPMFRRLIRRERNRNQKHARSGLMTGDAADLYRLQDEARLLRARFTIAIAQPGVSRSKASSEQLHLLGSTEVYIREVAAADFEVFCDA